MNKKKLLVFGLPLLLLIGVGSAALIDYLGSVNTSVDVEQGLYLDGNDWDDPVEENFEMASTKSDTFISKHNLENTADIDADVDLDDSCSYDGDDENSCDETNVGYYNYSEKKFPLEVAGDEGSEDFGDLYVTANPKEDTVVYEAEVPTDYFEGSSANLNFQVSPTDSEDEDNFQVTYYPGQSDEWDWKFMTPSLSKDKKVYGESNVTALDEVDSVEYIENDESPDVVKVVLNKPEAQQSFGVQASSGGGGTSMSTPNWEDKDGDEDTYKYGGFSDQGTESHEIVAEELSQPVKVNSEETADFAIVTEFPIGTSPGDYTIETTVNPVE